MGGCCVHVEMKRAPLSVWASVALESRAGAALGPLHSRDLVTLAGRPPPVWVVRLPLSLGGDFEFETFPCAFDHREVI